MRPLELTTKVFLESSNPEEVYETLQMLGFLDGVSTSHISLARNPKIKEMIDSGNKITSSEAEKLYKDIIEEIAETLPQGDIQIATYADNNTTAEQLIQDAKEKIHWTENARIKLPINKQGIKASTKLLKEDVKLNLNLCFNQEQAAAVYAAADTVETEVESLVSVFIGRLDDVNRDGTETLLNIMRMYAFLPKHVKVNASSIRDLDHFLYCLYLKPDYITAPMHVLKQWAESGMKVPGLAFEESVFGEKAAYFESLHEENLKGMNYKEFDFEKKWDEFNSEDELTIPGLQRYKDSLKALLR